MKVSDLNIPNLLVTEKEATFGDTLKTHAKSIGNRFVNRHLSNLQRLVGGGHERRGRYVMRQMADDVMRDWLGYKGRTGKPQTRANIYRFLSANFRSYMTDAELRKLTGLPPAPPKPSAQQQQKPAAAPPVKQGSVPTSGPPSQNAPEAPPTAATPQQQPSPPETQQPASVNPYTKQVAAQLKGIYDHILDLYHPQGSARKIRPPRSLARENWQPRIRLSEAEETITSLLQDMLNIGRKGDDETKAEVIRMIADLKRRSFTRNVPEIQSIPRGPEMFDANFSPNANGPAAETTPAPAPAANAQPTATVPPPGTQAPTTRASIPIMITAQMKQQLGSLGYAPDDVQKMTPEQAHQIINAQTHKVPDVNTQLRQFYTQLQQPQVNSNQLMAMLATLTKQSKGTPQENTVKQLIANIQQNPQMRAKLPQITQITVESRLHEADGDTTDPEQIAQEPLSRSEIDHIFVQIAQRVADQEMDSNASLVAPGGRNTASGDDVDQNYQAAMHRRLSPDKITHLLARNKEISRNDRALLDKIQQVLNSRKGPTTIGDLDRIIYHGDDRDLKRMPQSTKAFLLQAVI